MAKADKFGRRPYIHRDTLAAASAIYKGEWTPYECCQDVLTKRLVALHGNEDGSIPATFQIVYMVCRHLPYNEEALN